MTKFTEVFQDIKAERRLLLLFEQVDIEKMVTNREQTWLRVYMISDHLIQTKDVHKMEECVQQSLPGNEEILVTFRLRFRLSGQYTPQSLYEEYKESIYEELHARSKVDYFLVKEADISFGPDSIRLTVEDTVVSRGKEAEILDIFTNIYHNRCRMNTRISIDYKEARKNRYKEENDYKMDRLAEELWRRLYGDDVDYDSEYAELKPAKGRKKGGNGGKGGNSAYGKNGKGSSGNEDGERNLKSVVKSTNPNCLYGKEIKGDIIPISEIIHGEEEVMVRGKIVASEEIQTKSGKILYSFTITDFTDSITAKIFCQKDQREELVKNLSVGTFITMQGIPRFDKYDRSVNFFTIYGIMKIPDFTQHRVDTSYKKRVELHCHTKMSDSDGVTAVEDLIKRAHEWGMPALAVTDHGNVQAFPLALHAAEKLKDFKVLYGVEGYLVDDSKETVVNCGGQDLRGSFVVFDIETTGFSPIRQKIIEIGAVKVINGEITDRFSTFVNPEHPIPYEIVMLTGISNDMVKDAPMIEKVLPEFLAFCEGSVLVAHNAGFDMSFIIENAKRQGIGRDFTYLDTVAVSRSLLKDVSKHTLDHLCKVLKIDLKSHHRAVDDAGATAEIFVKFISLLEQENVHTLKELNEYTASSEELIRKLPTYHIILLAKNELGRVNLYRMITASHVTYFNDRPRIPKSMIEKYREGIIVGSACEAGELFQALLDRSDKTQEQIAEIIRFYDYLEIQPLGNNAFMLESEKHPNVKKMDDLIELNKRIVRLGEEYNKPVCATCDVHFMDPEDEVYRRIIMAGKGFSDADRQAPLYLRTTEEMLAEFEYLGSDKAEEVVITNTNLIADMCERVNPIYLEKCPPVIPNSDELLREICHTRAHELYGEKLPAIVEERLERELNSIISNGFAVMYIIAQKLVWKCNEDGYLVGSRGSVGSSFVATMAGITEVNPLPPHYYCPECKFSDFDSEIIREHAGNVGCDLPERDCPVCGARLCKDGFDIPFETFLGFKGDKEPDIDLNFSGEYQPKAHKYTEVIFGAGQTFRAGTVGTVATETAFGYVKKYFEERGIEKRKCELERLSQGCVKVKRTTGQHPGGIVVLPLGYDINQITPLQHPANDMEADVTTHFEYHAIDHNLLKLDILGHDDPSMIKRLQDLTGVDPQAIAIESPEIISLFQGTEILGVTPEDIGGIPTGTLGIPEFGTDIVIQMLVDTKPQNVTDLVRISGLSHGTDVWAGNAEELIKNNLATLSTAICTRDDIMLYLISKGLEPSLAFSIMEAVRKGGVAKKKCEKWGEWKQEMLNHDVPEWYTGSCEKIQYMFPKAHAAAYVTMACRIGYFKVNYPLAYYAAFFSIRAKTFSYGTMCLGREHMEAVYKDLKSREKAGFGGEGEGKKAKLTDKDKSAMKVMLIVREFYARGFEFEPIDIFRADAKNFKIMEGTNKLMPSLTSIDGCAEKAAENIVEAVKRGPFASKDDFRDRCKINQTLADTMAELGLLGDLPDSNQIKLFDLMKIKP